MKTSGEEVNFSVQHHCWSQFTEDYDSNDLSVRLIQSHPIDQGRALLTSIAIHGAPKTVRRFTFKIRGAPNVSRFDKFVTVPCGTRKSEAFAIFTVRAEGTITKLVTDFSPFHFSVRMQEGIELWKVLFLGVKNQIAKEFIGKITDEFGAFDIHSRRLTRESFSNMRGTIRLSNLDIHIIHALKESHYLDTPHNVGLRNIAAGLDMSASTLSRRIRKLESKTLSSLLDMHNLLDAL